MGQLNCGYFLLHSCLNAYQKLLKEVGKCLNCVRFLKVRIIASSNPICRHTHTHKHFCLCVEALVLSNSHILQTWIYTHKTMQICILSYYVFNLLCDLMKNCYDLYRSQ